MIQPVVKAVNRVNVCLHYTASCNNGMLYRFDNQLYRVYKHSTGCQTRLTTGLTNGCTQPVVITVVQPGLTTG